MGQPDLCVRRPKPRLSLHGPGSSQAGGKESGHPDHPPEPGGEAAAGSKGRGASSPPFLERQVWLLPALESPQLRTGPWSRTAPSLQPRPSRGRGAVQEARFECGHSAGSPARPPGWPRGASSALRRRGSSLEVKAGTPTTFAPRPARSSLPPPGATRLSQGSGGEGGGRRADGARCSPRALGAPGSSPKAGRAAGGGWGLHLLFTPGSPQSRRAQDARPRRPLPSSVILGVPVGAGGR